MRTSFVARAGALITGSALALSLGAGPVSAAETSTASGAAAAPSAAPASGFRAAVGTSAVPLGPARFGSGVITSAGTTRFIGTGQFQGGGGATALIVVNGAAKGYVPVLFSQSTPGSIALDIPRQWGSGKVQANINGYVSNTFYARKQVTSRATYPLKVQRRNSRMTFKARGIKIVNPSSGAYQSVKRVKLQHYKDGKWRTKKTIKLDRKGNGDYKTSIKKKYRYRLYLTRTATQEKFMTEKTGKI